MGILKKKMKENCSEATEATEVIEPTRKRRGKILQEVRTKKKDKFISKRFSAASAIEYFCRECMGWKYEEVKNCKDDQCSLHGFRLGKKT